MASADLLSPYGEGYCGGCQFVVGLDHKGRLGLHYRGRHLDFQGIGTLCPGYGRRPWKRTPYACRKNVFRIRVPHITCPTCRTLTPVVHRAISGDRLKHHWPADGSMTSWCAGSNQLVVGGRVTMPAK